MTPDKKPVWVGPEPKGEGRLPRMAAMMRRVVNRQIDAQIEKTGVIPEVEEVPVSATVHGYQPTWLPSSTPVIASDEEMVNYRKGLRPFGRDDPTVKTPKVEA